MARGKELSIYIKTRILDARKRGKDIRDIQAVFVSFSTVQSSVKKCRGFQMVENREGRGRKQKFSPRVVRKVVREVNLNPGITSRTLLNNLSTSGIEIYQSPLQRTFRKERVTGFGPRKGPLHQIKTSLYFANEHLEKDESFLLSAFWSDGKKLELSGFRDVVFLWQKQVKPSNLIKMFQL